MISGFPISLIAAIRCTVDGEALVRAGESHPGDWIADGSLVCAKCHARYSIEEGILNMLDPTALDEESRHEQSLRDKGAGSGMLTYPAWYEAENDAAEIIPTIEALGLIDSPRLLEIGCGEGRYTTAMHDRCAMLLATDFSRESLRVLARNLPSSSATGLVLADITRLRTADRFFDAILSTLVSNLPTAEHRSTLYGMCARALKENGRFVFGTHHYGIRQRFAGVAQSGRYTEGGIYRYLFTSSEVRNELGIFFGKVAVRPILAYLPYARRIRLPLRAQSRILERVPYLKNLGELLLCTAEQPLI